MLLTLTTTHSPATDLGFLLRKHPDRIHEFALSFGTARVFFPEASPERCTAALLVDVDPVGLVRRKRGPGGESFALEQYVNDRPYVGSSFLAVAIGEVFGSALSGRAPERPELADLAIPLEARIPALPARGGAAFLRRLFEPLGYLVETESRALDPQHPDWGESSALGVTLRGCVRLRDLLSHLTVLVPVLDAHKHYWVGNAEVEKLLRRGEGWLAEHPEREAIALGYLMQRRGLARAALERLERSAESDDGDAEERNVAEEAAIERPLSLAAQRAGAVLAVIRDVGAATVGDLGCGEGSFLRPLLAEKALTRIVGLDVSLRSLEIAEKRLRLDRLSPAKRKRIELLHGSLTYRDPRLEGLDALTLIEVIEHVEPDRLGALERCVFEHAHPDTVVVTTPNVEYNARFESLPAGSFRHRDHRFEWTRAEFAAWAGGVAERRGYSVRISGVGPEDAELGAPTQLAVFRRD